MTWTKIDDGLHSHPKVLRLRAAGHLDALGLHLLAMSYSGAYLTDGLVPRGFVPEHERELAACLVGVGLWDDAGDDGWQIHDWPEYNPSRADIEKARKANADRSRRSRETAARNRNSRQRAGK